jgi:hypothetical protein
MAATVTIEKTMWSPGRFLAIGTLNLGVYATNGVAVTPSQFGFSTLDDIVVRGAAGIYFTFDKTNLKILAYFPVQIVHTAAPAAQPVSVVAADTGLEATFGATANFPGRECINAVDISAFIARFEAIGF